MPAGTSAEPSAGVRDGMEAFAFTTPTTKNATEPNARAKAASGVTVFTPLSVFFVAR